MKNLTKTTLSIIAIVFVCSFFIQCKDAKDAVVTKYLDMQVEQMNKQCPLSLGGGLTLESCKVEGNKTMKFSYKIDQDIETFDTEAGKAAAVDALKSSPEIAQLKEYEITYKYEYKNASDKVIGEMTIAPDDYK